MPDTLLPLFSKQETADCRKMVYPSLGITWWVKLLKAGLKEGEKVVFLKGRRILFVVLFVSRGGPVYI